MPNQDYNYETCRKNLENLAHWFHSHLGQRNEATTRSQLIDRLFFECLGWSVDDAIMEEAHAGDYADYTFQAPRRVLIVEAKKEGSYFDIPAGSDRIEYPIASITRDNPNLNAAIDQASNYCQSRGIPFGAITNGHQVVAFVATRNDGIPPLTGKCLVFPSLDFVASNFLTLWQALSKPGIEERRLGSTLVGDIRPELPRKLSATIPTYPGVKGRNEFQIDLQILSELVLEDVARSRDLEPQFLEACYCQSGALSQYSLASKAILQSRYVALFGSENPGPVVIAATRKDGVSPELLADSFSRRPILLIGDVGAGKTTFIRHLIQVEATTQFANAVVLYIDLGTQATLSSSLREFIPDEMSTQLREKFEIDVDERNFVRGVYNLDLIRFANGIYGDIRETNPSLYRQKEVEFIESKVSRRDEHIRLCLEHVSKGRRQQVIVIIDNADQRDEETQQEAFLISQEIAERWTAMVFVSIRPETFNRSVKSGALSGYHPKAFTISPPRVDLVIKKRLDFALKLTKGQIPIHSLGDDMHVRLSKLESIIQIFLDTIDNNNDLLECIDNISSGNVRMALDLVKSFFGSGHINTKEMLRIYETSGDYYIPLHHFLRAVMFGDAEYYDPESSPVANLFEIGQPDNREHFLLSVILGALSAPETMGLEANDGFVDTALLYDQVQATGFTADQLDRCIIRASRQGLIETATRRIPQTGATMASAFRVTPIGMYHVQRLSSLFTYLDAVVVDTPILSQEARNGIKNVEKIEDRLHRARVFRSYLVDAWHAWGSTVARSVVDWDAVFQKLEDEITGIQRRVDSVRSARTLG